jgi:hypothetical protein
LQKNGAPGLAKVQLPLRRELSIPTELKEREQLIGGAHVMRADGLIIIPEKKVTEEARIAHT